MTAFPFAYLFALVISLAGVSVLDYRWKLCLFATPKRWAKPLLSGWIAFVAIDYVAISMGAFIAGNSPFASQVFLPGRMPIEEPFFLALLMYSAAMLLAAWNRVAKANRGTR